MLLCYYYEINLILRSPFPPTAVSTTIGAILLRSPFPPTVIAATIVVVSSAVVVVHPVPALFRASLIIGTPPFLCH